MVPRSVQLLIERWHSNKRHQPLLILGGWQPPEPGGPYNRPGDEIQITQNVVGASRGANQNGIDRGKCTGG